MKTVVTFKTKKTLQVILVFLLTALLVGCRSTHTMERTLQRDVYKSLGLEENKKDNFALYKEAAAWLNTSYVEGGSSPKGVDCSGFVYLIYKKVYEKKLERKSMNMLKKNCHRINKSRLKEGDLVFFYTDAKSKSNINHVGLYLKNSKFIHASTSKGVMISSLDEIYFQKTWVCGGRIK
jgi:hypothetical protein